MPNFHNSYLRRNRMGPFRIMVSRTLPSDGFYTYNLDEMPKNSYIHVGAECHNAPDEGGWCPVIRRVIKIYKGNAEDSRNKQKQSETSRTQKLMAIVFRR